MAVRNSGSLPQVIRTTAVGDFNDGSAAAPSITFINETTTGFYRVGTAQIGITFAGTLGLTLASTGLTFVAAQTFVFPATTLNALQFTNGTDPYYQLDTRAITAGNATHTFTRPAQGPTTGAAPFFYLSSEGTITFSGTPSATQHGRGAYIGALNFVDASVHTITLLSGFYFAGINALSNLTITDAANIYVDNPGSPTGNITNYSGIVVAALSRGTTSNVQINLKGGTAVSGVSRAGYVGISAATNGGAATLSLNAEAAITTAVQVGDTTIPILYNGTVYNLVCHT